MNRALIHSLTGLFVLAALLVAGLAVVSRTKLREWLTEVRRCEVWLPEAFVAPGDAVEFRSYRVGRVVSLEPRPWREGSDRWFHVVLQIDEAWAAAVTDAFTVTVSISPLGALAGSQLVLLAPGERRTLDDERPAAREGRPLASFARGETVELTFEAPSSLFDDLERRARDLLDKVEPVVLDVLETARVVASELSRPDGDLFATVRQLRRVADGLDVPVDDAVKIIEEARVLIQRLNDPEGSIQRLLAQAASIGGALERGEGVVGGLLREGELKAETLELLDRTNALLTNTNELLLRAGVEFDDVAVGFDVLPRMLTQLGDVVGRLDTASRSLPGLAEDVRRALEQANVLLAGVRESAVLGLFADFAPPPPAAPLVLPSSVAPGAR